MDETLTIWPIWQRISFRFFFIFFPMFILIFPDGLPVVQNFHELYIQPFQHIATWAGRSFFELSTVNFDGRGSGDTTGDYLLLLVIGGSALAGTVIWSVFDRQRKNYTRLYYWLIVIVRCYLIAIMTTYGFVKLFKTQFPYPSAARLGETYGQSSPMALAWIFFGYSSAYNYFMGFAEVSCALLLFFRRTTLLGALLTLMVSANIMAINYCYDVPVKILSTTLVVMSIFIIAQDAQRLFSFFFFNRIILPGNSQLSIFKNKWITRAVILTKYVLYVSFLIYYIFVGFYLTSQERPDQQDPLLGYYNVTTMHINEQTPLQDSPLNLKWSEIIISAENINVRSPGQEELSFPYKKDVKNHKMILFKDINTGPMGELSYQYVEPDSLVLTGDLEKNKINLTLKLYDWEKTQLIRRGFHWINEYPYEK